MNTQTMTMPENHATFEEAATSISRNTQHSINESEYRLECDALIQKFAEQASAENKESIERIASNPETLKRYFIRSSIESVRRIDCMRKINPLVCYRAAQLDPVLCKQWGAYAADEGLHSRMFARDLHEMGVQDAEIYSEPLFFSTELLCGYLYQTLEEDGPLAVVASSYYVELISDLSQPAWLDTIEQQLGSSVTKGARSHLLLDEQQDHVNFAWNMTMRLVKTKADRIRFEKHLHKLHSLLVAYVVEAIEYSLGTDTTNAAQQAVGYQS